jgi:hypothetical protein
MDPQKITSTQKSFNKVFIHVLQIHAQKPIYIKLVQWVFLLFPLWLMQFVWSDPTIGVWYELVINISLIIIFVCLYTYNLWTLIILRFVSFILLCAIAPYLSHIIFTTGLSIVGVDLYSGRDVATDLLRVLRTPQEYILLTIIWGTIMIMAMSPFIIGYAILWNQVERYKLFQLKNKYSRPSVQTEKLPLAH